MSDAIKINKLKVRNLIKLTKYKFDDRYVSDNRGNVYLIKEEEKTEYVCTKMQPFITKDGYVEYVLTVPATGKGKSKKQHIQGQIISAYLYNKPVPGKEYVNHKDGNRQNNLNTNLEFTTHQENVQHSFDKLGKVVHNKGKKKQPDGSYK
jgi:hypothetical protein